MFGVGEGVVVAEVSIPDTVQEHVHLRDGPGGAVVLLTGKDQIARVIPIVDEVLMGVDQHAPRSRAGVVHRHALFWIQKPDH